MINLADYFGVDVLATEFNTIVNDLQEAFAKFRVDQNGTSRRDLEVEFSKLSFILRSFSCDLNVSATNEYVVDLLSRTIDKKKFDSETPN